ncbi:MAG: hypothetical protein HRU03_05665 [Nanoarchaeales archaeon]|nr:hypothetical protein [Nanoarchaeales archaeon]
MAQNKGTQQKASKAQENREVKNAAARKKSMMVWGGVLLVIALIFGVMIGTAPEEINQDDLEFGDDLITMTYFHLSTCPHCHKQNVFNKYLMAKYPNLKIETYEMSERHFLQVYQEMADVVDGLERDSFPGTPTTVFNSKTFNTGYGSDETTGKRLVELIEAEQKIIDDNWDTSTMVRTASLRDEVQE